MLVHRARHPFAFLLVLDNIIAYVGDKTEPGQLDTGLSDLGYRHRADRLSASLLKSMD